MRERRIERVFRAERNSEIKLRDFVSPFALCLCVADKEDACGAETRRDLRHGDTETF